MEWYERKIEVSQSKSHWFFNTTYEKIKKCVYKENTCSYYLLKDGYKVLINFLENSKEQYPIPVNNTGDVNHQKELKEQLFFLYNWTVWN